MYSKFLLLLTTLIAAATLWTSCDDPQTCDCGDSEPVLGSIQIVTGAFNDTLYYLPDDSASTTVTVIVTDTRGLAYPGVQVDISLDNPGLGFLEFADNELQDTTNQYGRVNMVFRVHDEFGLQIIHATARGLTAQRVLVIREADTWPTSLRLMITPQLLEVDSNQLDSARVDITLVDGDNRGIPNVAITPSVTGGEIQIPHVTDSSGHSTCYWFFYNNFGIFQLNVDFGAIRDSVMVEVRHREEPYAGEYIVLMTYETDTSWFEPGDSSQVFFHVVVMDTLGRYAPGVHVDFTVNNPALGYIEFQIPNQGDTTDVMGGVYGWFRSFGMSGDVVVTSCVRDSCAMMRVALREIQPEPPQISVYTIPLTLRVDSNTVGIALIKVVARDEHGLLLPGITPTLSVEIGEFDTPPPTDSNGESETEWHFFNQFGRFYAAATIEFNGQLAVDSTLINVVYGP